MMNKPPRCPSVNSSCFAAVVSSRGPKSVQTLPVFLRAAASSFRHIGEDWRPCCAAPPVILGSNFSPAVTSETWFSKRSEMWTWGVTESGSSYLQPKILLFQTMSLKCWLYFKKRPGSPLCLWEIHSLWAFPSCEALQLLHLHARFVSVGERVGQIFLTEKVWDELRSHSGKGHHFI